MAMVKWVVMFKDNHKNPDVTINADGVSDGDKQVCFYDESIGDTFANQTVAFFKKDDMIGYYRNDHFVPSGEND